MPRFNITVTITAGTPICLGGQTFISRGGTLQTTKLNAAGQPQGFPEVWVDELSIQIEAEAAGGVGYVMSGISYLRVPSHTTDTSAQLAASSSATAPGGQWWQLAGTRKDLNTFWVDGSNTGDTITVSGNWVG